MDSAAFELYSPDSTRGTRSGQAFWKTFIFRSSFLNSLGKAPEATVPGVAITATFLFLVMAAASSAAGIRTPKTFLPAYRLGKYSLWIFLKAPLEAVLQANITSPHPLEKRKSTASLANSYTSCGEREPYGVL